MLSPVTISLLVEGYKLQENHYFFHAPVNCEILGYLPFHERFKKFFFLNVFICCDSIEKSFLVRHKLTLQVVFFILLHQCTASVHFNYTTYL